MAELSPLLRVRQGCSQGVDGLRSHQRLTGEGAAAELSQVVGRVQCLLVVWRLVTECWLESAHSSLPRGFLYHGC